MTIDEAITQLKMDRDLCNFNPMAGEEEPMNEDCRKTAEALDIAIKALEQEPILDKIRAEIKDTLYVDSLIFGELIDFKNGKISADDVIEEFNRVERIEALKIIDKYRTEREE